MENFNQRNKIVGEQFDIIYCVVLQINTKSHKKEVVIDGTGMIKVFLNIINVTIFRHYSTVE